MAPNVAFAQSNQDGVATPQATSPVPANDDRVGALWENLDPSNLEQKWLVKRCSANYLGNDFWLTAHHCIARNPEMSGMIIQDDGEQARIEQIHTKSVNDDIALIKVGEGIQAEAFELPSRNPEVGDHLTLVGFANANDFASFAEVKLLEEVKELDTGWSVYTDLIKTVSLTKSRSCDGDSGGAVYAGNVIYAVHTAGEPNVSCTHAVGSNLWHSNLISRVDWIKMVMADDKEETEETFPLSEGSTSSVSH